MYCGKTTLSSWTSDWILRDAKSPTELAGVKLSARLRSLEYDNKGLPSEDCISYSEVSFVIRIRFLLQKMGSHKTDLSFLWRRELSPKELSRNWHRNLQALESRKLLAVRQLYYAVSVARWARSVGFACAIFDAVRAAMSSCMAGCGWGLPASAQTAEAPSQQAAESASRQVLVILLYWLPLEYARHPASARNTQLFSLFFRVSVFPKVMTKRISLWLWRAYKIKVKQNTKFDQLSCPDAANDVMSFRQGCQSLRFGRNDTGRNGGVMIVLLGP